MSLHSAMNFQDDFGNILSWAHWKDLETLQAVSAFILDGLNNRH